MVNYRGLWSVPAAPKTGVIITPVMITGVIEVGGKLHRPPLNL
jgi:hypothetical protein